MAAVRISHQDMAVTETKMTTDKAGGADHDGTMGKRPNVGCRHFRPARRVARGRRPSLEAGSTVGPATLLAAFQRGSDWSAHDRDRVLVSNAG